MRAAFSNVVNAKVAPPRCRDKLRSSRVVPVDCKHLLLHFEQRRAKGAVRGVYCAAAEALWDGAHVVGQGEGRGGLPEVDEVHCAVGSAG